MQIALYGGSFNPPTVAHAAIVKACLELAGIDEVWLLLSGNRLDKQYEVADEHRVRMLELLREEVFRGDPRLKISRFELDELKRPTETYRTVAALHARFAEHRFHFVFGADSYRSMPTWQNGSDLQQTLDMLIVPRTGFAVPTASNIRLLEVAGSGNISSTEVRARVGEDQDFGHLVCESIRGYIEEHGLYS